MKTYFSFIRRINLKMPTECPGNGSCLEQTDALGGYSKYADTNCEYNCQPIKCPNFAVCREQGPTWYLSCHGGRCLHCKLSFGKNLTFKEEPEECPICMDTGPSVVQPDCSHAVCISCFKRCRFDGPAKPEQPPFPYQNQEDEYFDWDPRQEGRHPLYDDPLVVAWDDNLTRLEEEWAHRYRNEENLRKCPICRK
jgi:hypothetical protein